MYDIRLDMDLPIIEILCQAKEANQLPTTMTICDREQRTSDVELYAPGCLGSRSRRARGGVSPNPFHCSYKAGFEPGAGPEVYIHCSRRASMNLQASNEQSRYE